MEALAYSTIDNILATASENTIKLWGTNTGELIANLPYTSSINAIAFLNDGQTLAFASGDDIQIWDVSASILKKRNFTHLPNKIQQLEVYVSETLAQVTLEEVDSELRRVLPDEPRRWLENFQRLEKAGELTALRNLEMPDFFDVAVKKLLEQRKMRGVKILQLKNKLINADLPKLEKWGERPREKFEDLEAEILSRLEQLKAHKVLIKKEIINFVNLKKPAAALLPIRPKGIRLSSLKAYSISLMNKWRM